jgi:hypothetical protein
VPAQAKALATLVQATLTPIIAPLVAELAATRQTSERRADRIAELERENGRQGAELERAASTVVALSKENDALKASQAKQDANLRTISRSPPRGAMVPLPARLRAFAPWVLAVLAIVAVIVLLVWPRW